MDRVTHAQARQTAEVIDFDEALLEACPADLRAELLTEASLLAKAFAPDGRADQLYGMADQLAAGARDAEIGRTRARRLAAALRRLARGADT